MDLSKTLAARTRAAPDDDAAAADDEVFEIVDYTAASPLERLVAAIEAALVGWGVDGGRLGVLDPSRTAAAGASGGHAAPGISGGRPAGLADKPSMASLDSAADDDSDQRAFIRRRTIQFGDQAFVLAYHCVPPQRAADLFGMGLTDDPPEALSDLPLESHAHMRSRIPLPEHLAKYAQGIQRMSDFLVFPGSSHNSLSASFEASKMSAAASSAPATASIAGATHATHSPLHRWTSLTHLITFTGVGSSSAPSQRGSPSGGTSLFPRNLVADDPDTPTGTRTFAPGNIDINSCKLFASAFAIALANTACSLPVFVQTGQVWKLLFHGVMVSTGAAGSTVPGFEALDLRDVEQHYRMSFLPYVPPAYNSLSALCEIFKGRLGIGASDPHANQPPQPPVFASISTRYNFEFGTQDRAEWRRLPHEFSEMHPSGLVPGQTADPVLRLSLETHYPVAPVDSYVGVFIDPALSPAWHLAFVASADMRQMRLSATLRTALDSWLELVAETHDVEAIATDHMTLPGAFASGSGFSNARSLDGPRQRLVDSHDVMDAVRAIIETSRFVPRFQRSSAAAAAAIPTPHASHVASLSASVTADAFGAGAAVLEPPPPRPAPLPSRAVNVLPTNQIISQLQYQSVTVPMYSPMWQLAARLLDSCLASPKHLRFDAGIVALLKGVWTEFTAELAQMWELGVYLPGVDVRILDDENQSTEGRVDVDMRYTLLHQKLAMFNCCLYRKTVVFPSPENIARLHKEARVAAGSDDLDETAARPERQAGKPPRLPAGAAPSMSARFLDSITDIAVSAVGDTADTISKVVINPARKAVQASSLSALAASGSSAVALVAGAAIGQSGLSAGTPPSRVVSGISAARSSTPSSAASEMSPAQGARSTPLSSLGLSPDQAPSEILARSRLADENLGTGVQNAPNPAKQTLRAESSNLSFELSTGSHEGTSWTSDKSWGRLSMHDASSVQTREPGLGMIRDDSAEAAAIERAPFGSGDRLKSQGAIFGSVVASSGDTDLFFEPMEGWIEGKTGAALYRSGKPAAPPPGPGTTVERSGAKSESPAVVALHGVDLSQSFVQIGSLPTDQAVRHATTKVAARPPSAGKTERGSLPVAQEPSQGEVLGLDEQAGHLRQLEGLFLVATGAPMWLPQTQESGYMTEDMVREQEAVLESLGTGPEAAKLRARMQCAQLISDMEAFKAANPHAMLEDFVRWHSPRDWIETADGKGRLSDRMTDTGNLWRECWEGSRRMPASMQKPLFDYEKEAAKVVHYLESLAPQQILSEENSFAALSGLLDEIRQIERDIALSTSLLRKLPGQTELVSRLVRNQNTAVRDSERDGVFALFSDDDGSFPFPHAREYILQALRVPRHGSQQHPQHQPRAMHARMYALLMDGEFRLVESMSTDVRQ
ncbi:hypothetical protein HK105_204573 [Polyrhizophydium stewartii]|uniref:Rab3 GTPase-activating protein catalytic subunit n=1 Tax=Polyrhizophydium stewartii TaxID=2732419 RepID=A0ABR4N8M7_9FUNG